jgi:hypothetical protein
MNTELIRKAENYGLFGRLGHSGEHDMKLYLAGIAYELAGGELRMQIDYDYLNTVMKLRIPKRLNDFLFRLCEQILAS